MPTLKNILEMKGAGVVHVPKATTVHRAVQTMTRVGVGSVLVVEGGEVLGILTERDALRRTLTRKLDARTTPVVDVMCRDIFVAAPDMSVRDALNLMITKRLRHLPVGTHTGFLGVVSIGDLAKCAVRELERNLEEMTRYVGGPSVRHDSGWPSSFPPPSDYAEELGDDDDAMDNRIPPPAAPLRPGARV